MARLSLKLFSWSEGDVVVGGVVGDSEGAVRDGVERGEGRVGQGLAREACRGVHLVLYKADYVTGLYNTKNIVP